jgi:hypothetical protein
MVLTSDSHANPQSYFDAVVSSVEARGGRVTFYVYNGSSPDAAQVQAWRAAGHDVGMHPAAFGYGRSIDAALQAAEDYFGVMGYLPSATVRMHQIEWQGWVDAAKLMAARQIQMDTSFYTWGPAVVLPNGQQAHGYINGSGLPMRFVDQNGIVVPVYQQVTSLIDEQLVVSDYSEHLTPDQALAVTRQLFDDSQNGGYSAITAQFHVDYYTWGEVLPWAEGSMDYAKNLGVPLWNAERWLNYTTARAATTLANITWAAGPKQLSFSVSVPAGSEAQSIALPYVFGGFALTGLTLDGATAATTGQPITGRDTRFVNVLPGTHTIVATYATSIPPVNHPPVAVNDTAAATEATPLVINVLANDNDPDNDPLAVTSVTQGAKGAVTINANQSLTYTPAAGGCGADGFSYTIGDGRGGSSTANVSVPIACVNQYTTHTTVADFGPACSVATNAMLTLQGDGEVRLAGVQGDEFAGATLDPSQWVAGTWAGGAYAPILQNGVLSIADANGAFVRSTNALPATSVEASARIASLPWQHIGWADLDFNGSYAIFSTFNTTNRLFARTYAGGSEVQTDLGPIPAGFHDYRVTRQSTGPTGDAVDYYIDGVLVAHHTSAPLGSLYVYLSHSGGTAVTLDLDRVWIYPDFRSAGTFQSCSIDGGTPAFSWTTVAWDAGVPAATALQIRTRTSPDGTAWSGWSAPVPASGATIASPAGRFLQYLIEMASTDAAASPVVNSVTVGSRTETGTGPLPSATIDNVSVAEGNTGTSTATFTVSLSAASSQTITVDYATANGSATAGSDFVAASGQLTFAPGVTSRPIVVTINGDTTWEQSEGFVVNLTAPVNVTLGDAQGAGTITNDDTATMTVTAPNTAVTWVAGTTQTISWTNNLGSGATVRLDISRDGGSTWSTIVASAANSSPTGGSYAWHVTTPTTTQARVRATSTVNPGASDISNVNFTIANPTMTVTNPANRATWRVGTSAAVSWTSNLPPSENVRIELSINGGTSYGIVLSASTPNDGSFNLTVQSAWRTTRARVRVTWVGNTNVNDTSGGNFTIQ